MKHGRCRIRGAQFGDVVAEMRSKSDGSVATTSEKKAKGWRSVGEVRERIISRMSGEVKRPFRKAV
jgi:hypothetical protein